MTDMLVVYGTDWCGDCARARSLLDERGTPYQWINVEQDPKAAVLVRELNRGNQSVPTIVFPDGAVLIEPSDRDLEAQLARVGL
ncbi:MAG: NrdH-redoxin [Chloroflexi bacterium]|nr:NrdH-redoxin [Chloroflexota bacterium]